MIDLTRSAVSPDYPGPNDYQEMIDLTTPDERVEHGINQRTNESGESGEFSIPENRFHEAHALPPK